MNSALNSQRRAVQVYRRKWRELVGVNPPHEGNETHEAAIAAALSDSAEKDVITLCLRLCLEPADSHSPETREVLERYRPQWEAAAGGKIVASPNTAKDA